ncbi:MAG: primosomal protein N' [Steroidobacteraceae bacterium]
MAAGPVIRVAVDTPLRQTFDYLAGAATPAPGARVRVPFGRRQTVGVVIECATASQLPPGKLRRIGEVLDEEPVFDAELLALLRWAADYYHHPIGEVLFAALPRLAREGARTRVAHEWWVATADGAAAHAGGELRRSPRQRAVLDALLARGGLDAGAIAALEGGARDALAALVRRGWAVAQERPADTATDAGESPPGASVARPSPFTLTGAQEAAVDAVLASHGRYGAFLLHGITGSGKTEVYLQLVARVLARGERALVLVPEIGLTPQLVGRFAERFAVPMATLHSALTGTGRLAAWRDALSGRARIVLGTRSAVFAPLAGLGLVVIDEEHDASYKQHEGGFRYSARDIAVMRAQRAGVPVVLGSATPSLESLHNAQLGRYTRLALPRRTGEALPPRLALVDLRAEALRNGLSTFVVAAIRRHLDARGQVLVYLNRRGYAPTLACTACGWIAGCASCDARLTVYARAARLKCHHCGADAALPARCPTCGYEVRAVGQGTERVEETLAALFPDAPLARLDRDVVRRDEELTAVLARVSSGDARILVGTQMVTKGHDFPDVTLAVVLNADHGLFSTDFRAAERLAQTIVQVAGRAGRGARAGEVLIQTEYPEHPLLTSLLARGYEGFATTALTERRAAGWPPYGRLAAVRASAGSLQEAVGFLGEARRLLAPPHGIRLLGPAPAAMARRADRFHAQLLIESGDRTALHRFLATWLPRAESLPGARRVRWALDVDPLELF